MLLYTLRWVFLVNPLFYTVWLPM